MADNLLSHLFASKDLSIIILTEERDMCLEWLNKISKASLQKPNRSEIVPIATMQNIFKDWIMTDYLKPITITAFNCY